DGKFIERNEISDYSLDKFLGYIWMTEPDAGGSVYACRFKLVSRHTNNTLYSVGESQEENGSILKLKLINTSSPQNNPCSQLMWKNVYSLGKRFNQGDKITVRIKNYYENEPSVVGPDEIPYITLFGLDLLDEQGALIPDGKFDDMNSNLWNPENGLLIFPMLYPFVSSELYSGGNPNNDLINELGSGIIYSSTTSQSNVIEDSRFLIEIYYEN
ncbi:MAG: hypothetical protein ACE5D1_01835, partial [Fidelibacterota bacterium]